MYMSPNKEEGLKTFNQYLNLYEAKYPKACKCLEKDKDQLLPSMIFQPIIGSIFGLPTQSNRHLPALGIDLGRRRDVDHVKRRFRWYSSWHLRPKRSGDGYEDPF